VDYQQEISRALATLTHDSFTLALTLDHHHDNGAWCDLSARHVDAYVVGRMAAVPVAKT
jgi:hypothetical protein